MTKKIESHLSEDRLFAAPKEFSKSARIKSLSQYKKIYRESIKSPSKFWSSEAKELKWQKKWDKVLQWDPPFGKWFGGGKINTSYLFGCANPSLERNADSKSLRTPNAAPSKKLGIAIRSCS